MAKKRFPDNPTYIRIGDKAFSFSDPYSKLTVRKNQVVKLETPEQRRSGKIRLALRGGHLQVATEKEYDAYLDSVGAAPKKEQPVEKTFKEKLDDMTKAQLTEYYKDNYQVGAEDIEAFSKLKHDEMVEELLELDQG